jgi:hypothetical protein
MLQMGNRAPRTRPLPGAHGGSAQRPSPLPTVLGALGGCQALTFRRTATELPARRPDFLDTPSAGTSSRTKTVDVAGADPAVLDRLLEL